MQEVCDETGFARVDVVRVLKAVAAAEERLLADVAAHVEARVMAAKLEPITSEHFELMIQSNPFMRSLMNR